MTRFVAVAVYALVAADPPTYPNARFLVEPADPGLKAGAFHLLDVRGTAVHEKGHVPGSAPVEVAAWSKALSAGKADAAFWKRELAAAGVTPECPVVVVGDDARDTCRVWWMLKLAGVSDAMRPLVHRSVAIGESVNLARELANLAPRDKTPRILAERIAGAARSAGLSVEVWDRDRLKAERCGGLIGVAAGSDEPPFLVRLRWNGEVGHSPDLAIVGKGVTIDSGGLSLKPSASMEDMKCDMTGAAVAFAAMMAVARLGSPAAVTAFLPLTENMPGPKAMKLGDVLTHRNGKTVEILNTDAEGRLILADALALAAEEAPLRLVDLATLTGACMVALGTKVAGLFANDDHLAAEIQAASVAAGERTWRLPLDDDYLEGLKSQVADLKNIGGKWGGAITAAKFLQEFVDGRPWAHLDIAGPSWADSDSPTQDAGGTGCFVRTLVRLVESVANEAGRRR